jgi:hypothetical protein
MNRRGLLGLLGIGAAAPTLISNVPPPISPVYQTGNGYTDSYGLKDAAELWDPVKQLQEARIEYARMTGDEANWIAEYVAREYAEYRDGYSYRLETIDPDIRNMKSLSETAKVRMYIERKARRRLESNKDNVWERIQHLLKEV